jgi:hypothetical protein
LVIGLVQLVFENPDPTGHLLLENLAVRRPTATAQGYQGYPGHDHR